jgi:predicted glycoside hydrolase/deacetylase ChbG (UPF0249 family)
MALLHKGQANRLLGYPDDARLLIINADDFGMCHAVNAAVFRALKQGLLRSTTLMAPCPWAPQAMQFLRDHPEIAFGVHLTAISDWAGYRWRPIIDRDKTPSLLDHAGYFQGFEQRHESLARIDLDELETEFRAQIETVLAAGLHPTHLDWHALRIGGRRDIFGLLFRLAREYGLALRVMGRSEIESVQSRGLPCNDYDFVDSYALEPIDQPACYHQMLRELPAGLSEWAVHPGLENAELLAIEGDSRHVRQRDFDFLMSQAAQAIVKEEGILLIDYRTLQKVWQGK